MKKTKLQKRVKILEQNIRNKRLSLGVTQLDLAKKLKVTPQYICNIENGNTTYPIDCLKKISKYLNYSIEQMVNDRIQDVEIELKKSLGVRS